MADLEAQVKSLLSRVAAAEREIDTLQASVRKIGDVTGSGLEARLKAIETGKKDKASADQEAKKLGDKMIEALKAQEELRKLEVKILQLDAMTKPLVANTARILGSMK